MEKIVKKSLKTIATQQDYLSKTLKFIISKATENFANSMAVPVVPMSEAQEKKGLKAIEEAKKGNVTVVSDFSTFFNKK